MRPAEKGYGLPAAKANKQLQYVCCVRDDLTGFGWAETMITPTAENVITLLQSWSANFGIPKVIVCDRGSEFANKLVKKIAESWGTEIHYTTAYSPWSNGVAEGQVKVFCKALIKLSHELKHDKKHWPDLVPMVMSIVNDMPSARLGGMSPKEAFLLRAPSKPLNMMYSGGKLYPMEMSKEDIESHFAEVAEMVHTYRIGLERARVRKSTGVEHLNVGVGSMVLVARVVHKAESKLDGYWHGPYRVVKKVNDWVYDVENLLSTQVMTIHSVRLRAYCEEWINAREELEQKLAYNEEGLYVEAVTDHRILRGIKQFKVQWLGWGPTEATWEPIEHLVKCHRVVTSYMSKRLSNAKERQTWSEAYEEARLGAGIKAAVNKAQAAK